jgi:hypothetical protein
LDDREGEDGILHHSGRNQIATEEASDGVVDYLAMDQDPRLGPRHSTVERLEEDL